MKRCAIWLALITLIMGVCGCTMDHTQATENTTDQVVLNDRQREILAVEGLPVEYDALTDRQQRGIVAIEEMLTAVEAKYGMGFVYVTYSDGEILDNELLTVYPENGDPETDTFTVSRIMEDDGYVYSDGYAAMVAVPLFEAFVQEYAESQLGAGNVKVYGVVFNADYETLPQSVADIPNQVDGDCWIFIDGANVTADQYSTFAQAFDTWMKENGISGTAQLILLQPDVLKYLSQFNYTDYLSSDYYTDRTFCDS